VTRAPETVADVRCSPGGACGRAGHPGALRQGTVGAFGASGLKAWADKATQPNSQIVTGSSTGSPGPPYDNALRDAHLPVFGDRDVFEKRLVRLRLRRGARSHLVRSRTFRPTQVSRARDRLLSDRTLTR
jgi:hypothetical protein